MSSTKLSPQLLIQVDSLAFNCSCVAGRSNFLSLAGTGHSAVPVRHLIETLYRIGTPPKIIEKLKWLLNQHFSCLQFNPCPKNVYLDTNIKILSGLEAEILKKIYILLAILENGCQQNKYQKVINAT